MNRLEINATIKLMREQNLLPNDYTAAAEIDDIIAHVYDACARNRVAPNAMRREIAALLRERSPRNKLSD